MTDLCCNMMYQKILKYDEEVKHNNLTSIVYTPNNKAKNQKH